MVSCEYLIYTVSPVPEEPITTDTDTEGYTDQAAAEGQSFNSLIPEVTPVPTIEPIETINFPRSSETEAILVEVVPSDSQLTWIDDRNNLVDTWRNAISGDVVGIQNNLNIINQSLLNVGINVEDNTSQLQLMREELDELKAINSLLWLFYAAYMIEWTIKHLRGWRQSVKGVE